ncbi:hypothetical protein M0805_000835 [Coniferiporia weirii]|nr:hypothetical protein M0805_000835 [Coniferiporia weirii]
MASTAQVSSEPESASAEVRPQAGPLPRKRGEIGFRESALRQDNEGEATQSTAGLPVRHPADREHPPAPPADPSSGGTETSPPPASLTNASSIRKPPKHNALLSWLDPRPSLNKIKYGGITLTTIIRFFLQLAFIGGSIAAWVIVARKLGSDNSDNSSASGGSTGSDASSDASSDAPPNIGGSANIFVHVTFGIAVLTQLLFLERCIFFMRAQRYATMHPEGSRSGSSSSRIGMAFVPWNRPPLPTYAAALAQSGVGTGDVEDNVIAIPPPPAYGNTRGSTLVLAGFLRNSLRAAVGADRGGPDRLSLAELGEGDVEISQRGRPVSYRSTDEEWEERCNAERALRLADTLGRLENANSGTRTL